MMKLCSAICQRFYPGDLEVGTKHFLYQCSLITSLRAAATAWHRCVASSSGVANICIFVCIPHHFDKGRHIWLYYHHGNQFLRTWCLTLGKSFENLSSWVTQKWLTWLVHRLVSRSAPLALAVVPTRLSSGRAYKGLLGLQGPDSPAQPVWRNNREGDIVVQNFYLTQLRDVFVISLPRSLALLWFFFPVPLNHHLGITFNMGHGGGFFFVFLRAVGKIELLETGLFRGNL